MLGAVGRPDGTSTENVVLPSLAARLLAHACVGFWVDLLVRPASWLPLGGRVWCGCVRIVRRVGATSLSHARL